MATKTLFTSNTKYMKTIFTLLLSTLFSLTSMAYDGTRLTVTSISNNRLFVEVDGRRYKLEGNTVSLRNIRPGVHTVRVLREMKERKGRNIDIWRQREQVIYSIKATLKNGYHFDILVNRFGKVMIDERRIDETEDWYEEDDYYDNDRDNRDWDENRDPQDRVYDNDKDDQDEPAEMDDRDPGYQDEDSRLMSDDDFNMARESLRKEWLENKRLTTAKQIIDRNNFTSDQVRRLMLLFTFENNRLDIAKYAYGKTVDKRNYDVVKDAFTFNNNKEKLDEFIREYEE